MSVLDSLLVGIFGMAVVFVVLIGLNLLVRLQTALYGRFSQKKAAAAVAQSGAGPESPGNGPGTEEVEIQPAAEVPASAARPERSAALSTHNVQYKGFVKKRYTAYFDNKMYDVEVERTDPPAERTAAAGLNEPGAPSSAAAPARLDVPAPVPPEPKIQPAPPGDSVETITTPVPGTVLEVRVTAGAQVRRGEILIVLEAMKMENEIVATKDGKVLRVLATKGAAVTMGMPLVELQ